MHSALHLIALSELSCNVSEKVFIIAKAISPFGTEPSRASFTVNFHDQRSVGVDLANSRKIAEDVGGTSRASADSRWKNIAVTRKERPLLRLWQFAASLFLSLENARRRCTEIAERTANRFRERLGAPYIFRG